MISIQERKKALRKRQAKVNEDNAQDPNSEHTFECVYKHGDIEVWEEKRTLKERMWIDFTSTCHVNNSIVTLSYQTRYKDYPTWAMNYGQNPLAEVDCSLRDVAKAMEIMFKRAKRIVSQTKHTT